MDDRREMKIRYFAWVRDNIGQSEEDVSLPQGVSTAADLMAHLAGQSSGHARAFSNTASIRIAINQQFAPADSLLSDTDEIAFFPPVTGG